MKRNEATVVGPTASPLDAAEMPGTDASPEPRHWMSVGATAQELDIAPMTLYRLIREGGFPAVRIGRRLLIPAGALDAMYRAAVSTNGVVDAADWGQNGVA